MNARIQGMACGYRNRERFRNAILFHLGGAGPLPEARLSPHDFLKRQK